MHDSMKAKLSKLQERLAEIQSLLIASEFQQAFPEVLIALPSLNHALSIYLLNIDSIT